MKKSFEGAWVPFKDSESNFFYDLCENLVKDDLAFSSFKVNSLFCEIIGNDVRGPQVLIECLQKIQNKEIFENIHRYAKNDIYGNPPLYRVENLGTLSSGTAYFLLILDKIIQNFGNIENFRVCEIGSGYGGQATILLSHGVKSYACIDNAATLKLAKKYLDKLGFENVSYYDTDAIEVDAEYDLVISNWCLSEFDNQGMKFYIDNVVSKAKYGYFEMNLWDEERKSWLFNEMKKHFSFVTMIDEDVKTHQNKNFLLICKK